MSEKYSNMIEEVNSIINKFNGKNSKEIYEFLVCFWFDPKLTTRFEYYSDSKMKTISLREFLSERTKYSKILKLIDYFDKEDGLFEWVDSPIKNWKRRKEIKEGIIEIVSVFGDKGVKDHKVILEGIMNPFYRLTNYQSGSIVPIIDLLDDFTPQILIGHSSTNNPRNKLIWKKVFESILAMLIEKKVELPAPYYPNLSALGREDELYQTLIDLEEAFKEPRRKTE
jgi:hypothetical protein